VERGRVVWGNFRGESLTYGKGRYIVRKDRDGEGKEHDLWHMGGRETLNKGKKVGETLICSRLGGGEQKNVYGSGHRL